MRLLQQLKRSRAARIAGLSYAAFGCNSFCTLVSIPLAVAFLGKEQIALWTLISQFVGYLLWMDFGVGEAVGRKIADPIAAGDSRETDSWWTLIIGVLGIQGLLVMAAGAALWPWWVGWFEIDTALRPDAAWLYVAAIVLAGISMPMRAYPGMLLAQQRYAWVPGAQCLSPWVQLGVFVLCLRAGLGVKSYLFGMLARLITDWAVLLFAVHRGPLRVRFRSGAFTRQRSTSLFRYSGSVALIGFTHALTQSLPSLLLGRLGGLLLVPVYHFTARVPEIMANLSVRTTYAFYPAIQAHLIASERTPFLHKFRAVQRLGIALGMAVAGIVLCFNQSILTWLAAPDFFAGSHVNIWFAVAAISMPYTRSLHHLLQHSGEMGKSGWLSILTVMLGSLVAWHAYPSHGMVGIAAAFILLPLLIDAPYAAIRGSRNCNFTLKTACGPGILALLTSITLVLILGYWTSHGSSPHPPITVFGRPTVLPATREWISLATLCTIGVTLAIRQLHAIRHVAAMD